MKRKNISYIIFGTAILFIAGIGIYVWQQIKLAMNYCYKLSGFKINKLKINEFDFDLGVKIRNKSNLEAIINGYDFDIFINDKKVSHIQSAQKAFIKAKDVSKLWVNINFNPKEIFKDLSYVADLISYFLTAKEKIIIRVEGNISAQHSFIKIERFKIPAIEMNLKEIMTDDPQSTENEVCDI